MPLIEKNHYVKFDDKSHLAQIWYSNKRDRMFYFRFDTEEGEEAANRLKAFGWENGYHSSKSNLINAWKEAHQRYRDSQGSWSNVIMINTKTERGSESGFSLSYRIYAVKTFDDGSTDIYETIGDSLDPRSRKRFHDQRDRDRFTKKAHPYSPELHQFLDRIKMEIDTLAIKFEEFMNRSDIIDLAIDNAEVFSKLLPPSLES